MKRKQVVQGKCSGVDCGALDRFWALFWCCYRGMWLSPLPLLPLPPLPLPSLPLPLPPLLLPLLPLPLLPLQLLPLPMLARPPVRLLPPLIVRSAEFQRWDCQLQAARPCTPRSHACFRRGAAEMHSAC